MYLDFQIVLHSFVKDEKSIFNYFFFYTTITMLLCGNKKTIWLS